MKRLGLMMAFVAIVATAVNANNYFPQEGKQKTSKSQTVKKVRRPVKKATKLNTSAPVKKETKLDSKK